MNIIFIAPHFPANQVRFVRALKDVGAHVTGVGDAPEHAIHSGVRECLDDWIEIANVTDAGQLEKAVRLAQRRRWIDRLEAVVEAHMLPAAVVRERTGIPGLDVRQVTLCRDKALMKEFLRKNGVPCARSAGVSTIAEAEAFAQETGFPLIIKPRDGAGAQGAAKLHDMNELRRACESYRLGKGGTAVIEEFNEGQEGIFDTLMCRGGVAFEGVAFYYPGVLPAMRNRWVNPQIIADNRINRPDYDEVRALGRKVNAALGLTDTATHMEWFFGPKGLRFSEIGARPPGVSFWDCYNASNDFDIYHHWAEMAALGRTFPNPSRRYAAGLMALRPNKDGVIAGYSGVEELQAQYGERVFKAHLPPPGTPTQPVEHGFMANAWVMVKHPDYDQLRLIMDDIGRRLKVWAR
ncbi:MAG: hypothetical protein GMKNLPBB_01338 [Myxococcota bacterium]|nr:hypothetical protein [Myxococcota bacterium]